jgi:hypothetical protein
MWLTACFHVEVRIAGAKGARYILYHAEPDRSSLRLPAQPAPGKSETLSRS